MNRALNCWPWVWSLIHSPDAVTHSPAEMVAACPTTVISSRCPRAFIRRTQKPLSSLWKVTRSTRPARTSWVDGSCCGFMSIRLSSASALGTPIRPHIGDQLLSPNWHTLTFRSFAGFYGPGKDRRSVRRGYRGTRVCLRSCAKPETGHLLSELDSLNRRFQTVSLLLLRRVDHSFKNIQKYWIMCLLHMTLVPKSRAADEVSVR
jgi:hypothetical protein